MIRMASIVESPLFLATAKVSSLSPLACLYGIGLIHALGARTQGSIAWPYLRCDHGTVAQEINMMRIIQNLGRPGLRDNAQPDGERAR